MNDNQTLSDEKYEALFKYYSMILNDNKEMASVLSRRHLCGEAAKPFFISAPVAQAIINSFISGKRKVKNLISEDDFREFLKMRDYIYGNRNRY